MSIEKEHEKIANASCIVCETPDMCEGEKVHRHMVIVNSVTLKPEVHIICGDCVCNFVTYLFTQVQPSSLIFEDWLTTQVMIKEVMGAKDE